MSFPAASLLRRLRQGLRPRDRREPGRLNHISLGSHCHTAQVLKHLGLRAWSGPFDWIFSSPGMVRDCLVDDFETLLDRGHYESTPLQERRAPDETRCRHRLYAERHQIPFVFNHHDPASNEADYAFLAAGVRRLRAALSDPEAQNHLYLLTALPLRDDVVSDISDVLSHVPSRNFLNVLEVVSNQVRPRGVVVSETDRLRRVRLETCSPSTGLRFADPADDTLLLDLLAHLAEPFPKYPHGPDA